jgi:hypothetical protein
VDGLEAHFRRLRGKLTRSLGVQIFLVALVGLAAHRAGHWAAWIAFAVVAIVLGAGMAINVLRGHAVRAFQARLGARGGSLVWAHVDTQDPKQALLELWAVDGSSCVIPIPGGTFADAKKAAEGGGAVAVSRTREERAARLVVFENDLKLKRLETRLADRDLALSSALRPSLEAWITRWRAARAQAVLAPIEQEVSSCLDDLEALFIAAKRDERLSCQPEATAIVTRLERIVAQWSG